MEAQVALVAELQDFFRRRAELELDYSKSLDKMAKSIQMRHKEQRQKREQWPMFSSYACWQQLVNETKSLSRDHAALSEIYSTHLVGRLNQVMEDVQRIYRRVSVVFRFFLYDNGLERSVLIVVLRGLLRMESGEMLGYGFLVVK